jgi:osmotically-inducible protein OsmY
MNTSSTSFHGRRPSLAVLLSGIALLTTAAVGGLHPVVAGADETSTDPAASDIAELRTELAVRLALLESLGDDGLRIHIDVDGDRVALAGEVRHRSSQELAEEVAEGVNGVRHVRNDLVLEAQAQGPSGKPITRAASQLEDEMADTLLESKVKLRLLDRAGSTAFKVEVEATDGVVSLRGKVPDREHRKIVLEAARETAGVRRVINLLKVA